MNHTIILGATPPNESVANCGYVKLTINPSQAAWLINAHAEAKKFLEDHGSLYWGKVTLEWDRFVVFGYPYEWEGEAAELLDAFEGIDPVSYLDLGQKHLLILDDEICPTEIHSVVFSHDNIRFQALPKDEGMEIISSQIPTELLEKISKEDR